MKKQMAVVVVIIFTMTLSANVYAGWKDLVASGAQTALNAAHAAGKKQETTPEQSAQQQGAQGSSQEYATLEKGVYGIPFKADLATVLKWCEDNKVEIQNSTKEQVEDKSRELMRKIKNVKNEYEGKKFFLSEAEKDMAAITLDPQVSAMEKMAAEEAQKTLETLNNPTVDYGGKTYLLKKRFPDGIRVEGANKLCTDKRITDSIFSLTVSPSGQSQKLLNQSLSSIDIEFFKDESGIYSSYTTTALFENGTQSELRKQYEMLSQVLSQKYGSPSGGGSGITEPVQWRKNVWATGEFGRDGNTNELFCSGVSFKVEYIENGIYDKIVALQAKAVEDFKTALANEDANKAKAMQNNF